MSGKGKGGRGEKKESSTSASSSSAKAGLQFPVGRIGRHLREGKYAARTCAGAPIYLAAVLEYLCAEILELSGNVAAERDNNNDDDIDAADGKKAARIIPEHITLAVKNDEELIAAFSRRNLVADDDDEDGSSTIRRYERNIRYSAQKEAYMKAAEATTAASLLHLHSQPSAAASGSDAEASI
eukprot:CAMPEP_0181130322 /NCGR_PEP_ID=MMETSP1071-20121207/29799_1 /TAXON_ID=35127 /ORGANISM="Thalassiosira sp., Strain NH16" /LENGTH=182 /DNA_ID=CAMNT_0023216379 /DNA_START=12 /DNA_END=560 /DNA_ORIENTATION=+